MMQPSLPFFRDRPQARDKRGRFAAIDRSPEREMVRLKARLIRAELRLPDCAVLR